MVFTFFFVDLINHRMLMTFHALILICRFIEKFGTHVIVGVKMGGKDVICMRQQKSSNLQPIEVQKRLKEMADKRFPDVNGQYGMNADEAYEKDKVFFFSLASFSFIHAW